MGKLNDRVSYGSNATRHHEEDGVGGSDVSKIIVTTTDVSKDIVEGERCFVIAPGCTITLPANPAVNDEVSVGVQAFEDTVIANNSEKIMGEVDSLIIDKPNVVVTLLYTGELEGWRIV